MRYFYLLHPFCLAFLLILSACGNDNLVSKTTSTFAASETCINCHKTSRATSAVTAAIINDEWSNSAHNSMNGASCIDCHGSGNGHPNSCGGCHGGSTPQAGVEFHDPEKAEMCYKCHGLSHPNDAMLLSAPQHFGNQTTSFSKSNYRASYISSRYAGNCRKCHNPHDPTSQIDINRQWAESGMGETTSATRVNYDFKTRGSYEPVNLTFQNICVRCHTSTGYINFVNSDFSVVAPFAGPGYAVVQNVPGVTDKPSADKTKEVTGCDVCHDDGKGNAYGWKLRSVSPVQIYYNYSGTKFQSMGTKLSVKINDTPVNFPNAGASNMCIPCHAGRGVGSMITAASVAPHFLNFSTTTGISSHDFAGAGNLFHKSGYEYSGRDYSSGGFLHEFIGINNTNGTGTLGPCITCHMNSSESHTFLPVTFSGNPGTNPSSVTIIGITSRTCAKCHNGSPGSVAWTANLLQTERAGFHAALAVFNGILSKKRNTLIRSSDARVFENLDGITIKGSGPNTMGANFNYNNLKNDWGAYAHNDLYAKRLIYDSIDWLYDRDLATKTNTGGYATDVEAAIATATVVKNPWSGLVYSDLTPTTPTMTAIKNAAISYLLGGPGGGRP